MKPFIPEIIKLKPRTVLTLTTVGDPNKVAADSMPALFGTAYQTKFKTFKPKKKVMVVGKLAARWPDAHLKPKSKWTGVWGLEVSDFVKQKDLVMKHPTLKPKVVTWPYGTVAQVLYVGPYTGEGPTIKKLHAFVTASGYRLAGPHEEEYLTKPGPKAKTIIRYVIAKAKATR